jgi:chemotaxis protein methyltransferase CheR
VDDRDCIAFLQWALPQQALRWPGFRKVRRQVCKRLKQRIGELGLDGFAAYRRQLELDPAEWHAFDECCHITISRFFRDKGVFEVLRKRVLPNIAARVAGERRAAHIWSAGCASGEEPYTVKIVWDEEVARSIPGARLSIVASDIDRAMLDRARRGCFASTSLRELPQHFIDQAFGQEGALYCIKPRYREGIEFLHQDLRSEAPSRLFDLILCRYVAFTYFAEALQRRVLMRLVDRLAPHGYLAIGTHEQLPIDTMTLQALPGAPQIFARETVIGR